MGFQKGNNANPNGRPRKKRALSEMLRTISNAKGEDGLTKRRKLAETVWEMALVDRDIAAIKLIYEYCDGKPTEHLEHTGPDGEALVIQIERKED